MNAFSPPKDHTNVVRVEQWVSATLTGGVRLLFANGDHIPVWPMTVVPGLSIVALALLTIQLGPRLGYLEGSLLSALLSMTFGPFGWVFDFTILLPGYLICILQPMSQSFHLSLGRRIALLVPALLVQLGGWCCLLFFKQHHLFMWFAPTLLLSCRCWRKTGDKQSSWRIL